MVKMCSVKMKAANYLPKHFSADRHTPQAVIYLSNHTTLCTFYATSCTLVHMDEHDFCPYTHGVILLHIPAIVYYINTLDGLGSQMWEGQGRAL